MSAWRHAGSGQCATLSPDCWLPGGGVGPVPRRKPTTSTGSKCGGLHGRPVVSRPSSLAPAWSGRLTSTSSGRTSWPRRPGSRSTRRSSRSRTLDRRGRRLRDRLRQPRSPTDRRLVLRAEAVLPAAALPGSADRARLHLRADAAEVVGQARLRRGRRGAARQAALEPPLQPRLSRPAASTTSSTATPTATAASTSMPAARSTSR